MTAEVAPWIKNALVSYKPSAEVLKLVKPFTDDLHAFAEKERKSSTGLHDLDVLELTYQYSLEVGAALLLAADSTDDPVDLNLQFHATRADGDDHFVPWGRLLTGLECDPPVIGIFPFYLLLCHSFTLEPNPARENYIYASITPGIDWVRTLPLIHDNNH